MELNFHLKKKKKEVTEMRSVEELVNSLHCIFTELPKHYEANENEITELDKEQQDLLHIIELTRFDAYKGFKYAKEIQRLRERRRELKDENELLINLYNFANDNKKLSNSVNTVKHKYKQTIQVQANRSYKFRVREEFGGILPTKVKETETHVEC